MRRLLLLLALALAGLGVGLPGAAVAATAPTATPPTATALAATAPAATGETPVVLAMGQPDAAEDGEQGTSSREESPAAPPAEPAAPADPAAPSGGSVRLDVNGINGTPSTSLSILLGITVLSVAPALLLMCTSFTKIVVVLSLTRNALGLQATPPNQVLVGLALFLSLFIMGPVLSEVVDAGVTPYLDGAKSQSQAFGDGIVPLREFMLDQTRDEELALLTQVADEAQPESRADVPLTTLLPAFVLSELKSAFIIGFVIFIPFLVIDIVVSSALMSMGMMMLPPVMISLPFKLLLFVLVDGWGLIVTALVQSYG